PDSLPPSNQSLAPRPQRPEPRCLNSYPYQLPTFLYHVPRQSSHGLQSRERIDGTVPRMNRLDSWPQRFVLACGRPRNKRPFYRYELAIQEASPLCKLDFTHLLRGTLLTSVILGW